jgi:transcriptional regulator with XRE-family HTH domain
LRVTYHEEIHGMESLGRILRAQREARGWSVPTAARKLSVTAAALGTWERGERNPPMYLVVGLLSAYGLHLLVTDNASLGDIRQARIEALRAELAQLEAS